MEKFNKKKCSIIYPGRNDDYNPHFLNRLNYVLEFTANNIFELGLEHFFNLVVVDWGSDKKFRNELVLSSNNAKIINFYEISKEITSKEVFPKNYFHVSKIYNTGIRRANTEYIMLATHDVIINKISILNLYNLCKCNTIDHKTLKNSLFQIQRFFLPDDLFDKTPSFKYLSRWINRSGLLSGDMGVTVGGSAAAHFASKVTWEKLSGFDEKLGGYGYIDNDLHSRANMIVPYFDSFKFGISMLKIPRGIAITRQKTIIKNVNPDWTSFTHKINNNDWGISKYKIPNLKSKNTKKNINEEEFILTTRKYNHSNIATLLSIFLVPVRLRIFYISFLEVILINYLRLLISQINVRSIIIFGYKDAFIPLYLGKVRKSAEIFILDNIKKAALKLHKSNPKKTFEENSIGMTSRRLFLVGSAFPIGISSLINHLGYFRAINSLENTQVESVFKDMPQEKNSNIFFFRYSEIQHLDFQFIKNKIIKYSDKIFAIIFFDFDKKNETYLNFNDFTFIKIPFIKIKILLNNKYQSDLSVLKQNISKYNYFSFIILFVLTNLILICCIIFRILKSFFRRIISFFSSKD